MITVVVKCRKHPSEQIGDFEIDPEDDEHVVRVDPCERCIDEAEQDGKDSQDDEVDDLRLQLQSLSEVVEQLQEQLESDE